MIADGTALTIAPNGSFWIENPEEVERAIDKRRRELEQTRREITDAIAGSGVEP